MKIKIIDSIMGSGKSTWSFDYMYKNKDDKFIYITPYLNEIKRLVGDGTEDVPFTKWYYERRFREPKHLGEGKLDSLHNLLANEYSVATTHALFKMCKTETIDLISAGEYVLILDESLDVIELIDMNRKDYEMLLKTNKITVNDNVVKWIDHDYSGDLSKWKNRFKNGVVIELKKTNKVQLLIWNFNIESFLSFKEIYIMTYLFESSYLKYYFDIHNVKYEKYSVEDYMLIEYENKKPYNKEQYKQLINIYDGNLNNIGDKETSLSLNWFKNNKDLTTKLKNNIYNYFNNIVNTKSDEIIWTTFKSIEPKLKGKGYTKSFIPCNSKATNKYKNCNTVAYCCNRFLSPDVKDYFTSYKIRLDEEIFALSEMLQFIWRSSIRDGKQINLYCPSHRMRDLLIWWINNPNV
jgi:hypothetical protein